MNNSRGDEVESEEAFQARYLRTLNESVEFFQSHYKTMQELDRAAERQSRNAFLRTWQPIHVVMLNLEHCIKTIQSETDRVTGGGLEGRVVADEWRSDEEGTPFPRGLKRRSESRVDHQGDVDDELPCTTKRRRFERKRLEGRLRDKDRDDELRSVKEESVQPSVEVDNSNNNIAGETTTSSWKSNGLHFVQKGPLAMVDLTERNYVKQSSVPTVDATGPAAAATPHVKTESPFPTNVKVESPMPDPSSGVFVKAETPDVATNPAPNHAPVEIEYEDISAEVEARVKSNEERRRNQRKGEPKPAPKRKRERISTGSEGREPKRESLGRAAKAARVRGSGSGSQMGIKA